MKKLISAMIMTGIMTVGVIASAKADGVLRIASEGAYPPFNNMTADGELVGFDIDIAKALCAEMKRKCELVAQDWDGIIPSLVNNKYDAIIASVSITEERLKVIDFTNPYYSNYLSVIAKDGAAINLENLGDFTVGAQRSTVGSQWLEDNYGRRADIKLYDTNPAALSDLESGRIDAVVADFIPAEDWLSKTDGFSQMAGKIDIGDMIGIGIRKGEDALKADFNVALKAIRENGTYQAISNEYFGTDIF